MLHVLFFSLLVTALCCYAVHMLLEDRFKLQSSIYNALLQADKDALARKININSDYKFNNKKNRFNSEIIDITLNKPSSMDVEYMTPSQRVNLPQKKRTTLVKAAQKNKHKMIAENIYPIIPKEILKSRFNLDVRV